MRISSFLCGAVIQERVISRLELLVPDRSPSVKHTYRNAKRNN